MLGCGSKAAGSVRDVARIFGFDGVGNRHRLARRFVRACIRADRQDRDHQQLFRLCRRGSRRDAEGHRSLCKIARKGPAGRRQTRHSEARRHLEARCRQALGTGTDRPRPCEFVGRRDPVAGRRRSGAVDRRGQDAVCDYQRRGGRDPAAVALCRAGLVHLVAGRLSDRQVGGRAGLEDGLYRGHRLYRRT